MIARLTGLHDSEQERKKEIERERNEERHTGREDSRERERERSSGLARHQRVSPIVIGFRGDLGGGHSASAQREREPAVHVGW
jgi:hypothetical protein